MITSRWFVTCDRPGCANTVEVSSSTDEPDGWRIVRSTEHIPAEPGRAPRRRNHSARAGAFQLHLCLGHTDFFDEHLPQTYGSPSRSGDVINVSCGCGVKLGWTRAQTTCGADDGRPRYLPELNWWRHLPTELRAYNQQRDGEGRGDDH